MAPRRFRNSSTLPYRRAARFRNLRRHHGFVVTGLRLLLPSGAHLPTPSVISRRVCAASLPALAKLRTAEASKSSRSLVRADMSELLVCTIDSDFERNRNPRVRSDADWYKGSVEADQRGKRTFKAGQVLRTSNRGLDRVHRRIHFWVASFAKAPRIRLHQSGGQSPVRSTVGDCSASTHR